ncbi:sensor histidine kinase [Fusibacter sp. 3D3]|uniref:sensor histidine kinase n=1 Tax=Fusibacter sp. 3D3 TaxID=1048380 RepID=UPI000A4AE80F|nr:histidine kinase [Fusibacter sp. 3D3]
MNRIRRLFLENTLKKKVFTFTLVLLMCFILAFAYTFLITSTINSEINQMFSTSIVLNELLEDLQQFEINLETYLSTKSSDSFVNYLDYHGSIKKYSEVLNYGNSTNSTLLQLNNIHLLLDQYLEESEKAIDYKRARNTEKYLERYSEILLYSQVIHQKVAQLEIHDFKTNLGKYLEMTENFKSIRLNFVGIIGLLIVLSIFFVLNFSTNVTRPIEALSVRAEAITQGQYDIEQVEGMYFKEAEVLKKAFQEMAAHINEYIKELEDKVDTENKLRVSETEKLKMQNLLNQAELLALQAQINPHFLFNTLNAGMQLAIIENADRTVFFLDHLSQLFRYNIQSLNNRVKLSEELKNVRNYYELMKIRFGDQLEMHLEAENNTMSVEMPPMILQPLVENAMIHGFRDKMDTGIITLIVKKVEEEVLVSVLDNGNGISDEKLKKLNAYDFKKDDHEAVQRGHTTGLGLENVYERLKHFYGKTDVLEIKRNGEEGAEVVLHIPISIGRGAK